MGGVGKGRQCQRESVFYAKNWAIMSIQYCAIIGDINNSRQLERRGSIQVRFKRAIRTINTEFESEIASPFMITLGDEFQGLLSSPVRSYRLARRLQDLMEPVPFAFGIGIGNLETPLNRREPLGMDGPCFHNARKALLLAKKNKNEIRYQFDDPAGELVNAIVISLDKQWQQLSENQREILKRRKEGMTQLAIAKKLHITKQAVSKSAKTGLVKEMNAAVDALESYLVRYRMSNKSTI